VIRLAVWTLAASVAAVVMQNPPSFRARADAVSIDVAVKQGGRPVTGLTAGDFELLDNGVPQTISQLSYETLPIDLTVALDVSQSVTGSVLDQLRRGVQELARDLTAKDRLRVLTFNVRITRLIDFGAPLREIDAAFDTIRPLGTTALRDAVAVALTTPSSPDRRQLLVVFSDGDDRSSTTTRESLLDAARRTTPTIGFVLASPPALAADPSLQIYGQLAKETGGFLEFARADRSLGPTFRKVLTEFRRSYVLYFVPTGVERAGVHTLAVKVKREGAEVRARTGYTSK
jgi:VWFA-related protein